MTKLKRPWITFFSQTGAEIADLSESIGYWPDAIVTNHRPDHLRTADDRILESQKLITLPNKPTPSDYLGVIEYYKNPVITLHGWLRILPPYICDEYLIYNGHPGLITLYPELKGKDPQVRAYEGIKSGKYKEAGAVIHRVVAGVDEGTIISSEIFNAFQIELDELFLTLRDRSIYMWKNLLKKFE